MISLNILPYTSFVSTSPAVYFRPARLRNYIHISLGFILLTVRILNFLYRNWTILQISIRFLGYVSKPLFVVATVLANERVEVLETNRAAIRILRFEQ